MKKIAVIITLLAVLCSGLFAQSNASVGFSLSPYIFEKMFGQYNSYKSTYGAGGRFDFDYSPINHLNVGLALMTTYNKFNSLDCHSINAYYAMAKVGIYAVPFTESKIGVDAQFALEASHVHPYSKPAFACGCNTYFKYFFNSRLGMSVSVDTMWNINKATVNLEKVHSFVLVPQLGFQVKL